MRKDKRHTEEGRDRIRLNHREDDVSLLKKEERKRGGKLTIVPILIIALAAVFLCSLLFVVPYDQWLFSPAYLSDGIRENFSGLYAMLFGQSSSISPLFVRYIAIAVTGAALAACGAAFQGGFRNTLAGPSTMGVMSGGSLGCLLYLLLFTENTAAVVGTFDAEAYASETFFDIFGQEICTLAGCFGGVLLVVGVAMLAGRGRVSASAMILSGTGATAGVKLGNVLVVMVYSTLALEHIYLRYLWCYLLTGICVGAVLLIGRLAGNHRENFSILEMVMAGSIVSQALNVITMYIMYNLDDESLVIYEEISMGTYLQTDAVSVSIFFGVMAVAIIPVLILRYRLNIIALDRAETTSIGIQAGPLRIIAQLCGVLMVTCAMIHFGEVGMISMVVSYIVREIVGADFRKVCLFSAIWGGILMMVCRVITSFIYVAGEPIPAAFAINLILVPVFMVILARQGRKPQAEG